MNRIIRVGERDGPFAAFANGAPYALRVDELTWPTAVHYIEARKFPNLREALIIRHAPSAEEASALASAMAGKMWTGWEQCLPSATYSAVYAKFSQHLDLEELLLETGDAYLHAVLGNDCYWGIGAGFGANALGKTLMKVRGELRLRHAEYFGAES